MGRRRHPAKRVKKKGGGVPERMGGGTTSSSGPVVAEKKKEEEVLSYCEEEENIHGDREGTPSPAPPGPQQGKLLENARILSPEKEKSIFQRQEEETKRGVLVGKEVVWKCRRSKAKNRRAVRDARKGGEETS